MKYIFFGTPEFAEIVLERLIAGGYVPQAVVCNPDRPVGRKKIINFPPTKILAQKHGIPVWQPERLSAEAGSSSGGEIRNWKLEIDKLGGVEFAIVAAYGKLIPESILDSLPDKFIGVHPSLLPRHRGPSPIQSAILENDAETGVTLYLVDKEMDHGPMIASGKLHISNETYKELERKLAELGAELLIKTIPGYLAGKIVPEPQDHARATFNKKFETEDGFIPENDLKAALEGKDKGTASAIDRKIRALTPEPGVWTKLSEKIQSAKYTLPGGKRIKLLELKMENGALILLKIQVEGKTPV